MHRGVNRTFQVPKPFMQLTARENVEVAIAYGHQSGWRASMRAICWPLNLDAVAERRVPPPNQQRTAEDARPCARWRRGRSSCSSTNSPPGPQSSELDWVAGKLKELARAGMSIIVVEHLMGFIEQVTDRVG